MAKNKQNWLLAFAASITIICTQPIFAQNHISIENTNNEVCQKIHEFSALNRQISKHTDKKKYNEISRKLNFFIIPFAASEGNKDEFKGLDIDGDGENDQVVRDCGAGAGGLCTLSIVYSNGGQKISEEMGHFYLGNIDNNIYVIEEVCGDNSPYTDKDITRIFQLSKDSIDQICTTK